jgi:putative oxidoreductase
MGILFLAHAGLKLFVFTPPPTAASFTSLGLPGPLAYLVIAAKLVGGIALILGILSRWVSLGPVPILLGSIYVPHGAAGCFFSNEGGACEFPAFWAVELVVQALLGDGAYGLNRATPDQPVGSAAPSRGRDLPRSSAAVTTVAECFH